MTLESKSTLRIEEATLAYALIRGDAALPHLVFLHEGLGCTAMWGDFPERLCRATGCPGLVYDRAGYGQSSPLPAGTRWDTGYLHRSAQRELPQVMALLVPPSAPYILVGHSDGGSIALIHGAERNPRLRGIVTIAAHVFVEAVTLAGIRDALAAWHAGKLAGLARYHGEKTADVFRLWSDAWLDPTFASWNIEALLPRIDVPLLVMQGQDDQYGTARQVHSIARHSGGPAKEALLPGCGHTPHKECPEAVLSASAEFIRSLATRMPLDRTAV